MDGKQADHGPGQARGEPEIRHYANILRRRIWVVVTVFVIVVTIGAVSAFKAAPIYRASARILIEQQSPRVMDFEDVVKLQSLDQGYYKTQQALVSSRAVLEKALEQPGMQELFRIEDDSASRPSLPDEISRTVSAVLGIAPVEPAEPWERLRQMLVVEFLRDTQLLQVAVESPYPRRAARIATAVARAFEAYHLERKQRTSNDAFRFLKEQQTTQETALRQAENALQQFREKTMAVSLDVADKDNPVLARLRRLNHELTEVQLSRIELAAQIEVLNQAIESGTEGELSINEHILSFPRDQDLAAVVGLQNRLAAVEQDVAALSTIYGPDYPRLVIAQTKAQALRQTLRAALSDLVKSASTRLAMLHAQEREIADQYAAQNRSAIALARHSLNFGRLQSETHRQRKLFDVLLDRMREVDLTGEYARTNVEVVEAAEVPRLPVRPRKLRAVLSSLILGLLLGVGLAFLLEHLDDTIKTPEDLETRLAVPVLGFVPAMDGRGMNGDGFAGRSSFALAQPRSTISEAYRNIRTNLFFSAPSEEMRVLVVTSGGPRDGKTTTCANLAAVIAQSGKRVLLVDADFHHSKVHEAFGLDRKVGLSNVLVGEMSLEEAAQQPVHAGKVVENLDVLAAGPKPPNPAELLGSDGMRRLLGEARKKYDRVIIDTPPVLSVTDGNIMAGMSDGVIMVVKAAKNTRGLTRRARDSLNGVRARILGGILNNVRVSRLGYYYSDYYRYGYAGAHGAYYSDDGDEQGTEHD